MQFQMKFNLIFLVVVNLFPWWSARPALHPRIPRSRCLMRKAWIRTMSPRCLGRMHHFREISKSCGP